MSKKRLVMYIITNNNDHSKRNTIVVKSRLGKKLNHKWEKIMTNRKNLTIQKISGFGLMKKLTILDTTGIKEEKK